MTVYSIIPVFGDAISTVIAFVIALSIIVAIHEYGHYIVGRWSGIEADVFSIGFGPVLFSRIDSRGTRWQIAALPLGGYVKFRGDADAASSKDVQALQTQDPAELRKTMHGAPVAARMATVVAGPVFNFILSIAIFFGVLMMQGVPSDPLTVGRLLPNPAPQGLKLGDEILGIEGVDLPSFNDGAAFYGFLTDLPDKASLTYAVRRAGMEIQVQGPHPYPAHITQLAPQSAAYAIDMKVGDVITAVDGMAVFSFNQLKGHVENSNGKVLKLDVWRAGEQLQFALTPRRVDEPGPDNTFVTQWRIGIVGGEVFEPATQAPGVWQAFSAAVARTLRIIEGSLSGMYHMITGAISSCNLSGPIGIAQVSGAMASQGGQSFIVFIAVLSTAIGLLNLFPIPPLDGGQLLFFTYEAITGRPANGSLVRFLMVAGLAAILALMVFGVSNDLFCP